MIENLREYTYLRYSLFSYLLLGSTDTIHHLHAALALKQNNAIHAVWTGVILIPLAILMVIGFLRYRKRVMLWCFFTIATLAILLPGFYHGGWDHLVKILAFLRVDGESTDIYSLFPLDNLNLWFYEVSGSLEFFLAVISAFFLYKVMLTSRSN